MRTGRRPFAGQLRLFFRIPATGTPASLQNAETSDAPAHSITAPLGHDTVGLTRETPAAARLTGRRRAARTGLERPSVADASEFSAEGTERAPLRADCEASDRAAGEQHVGAWTADVSPHATADPILAETKSDVGAILTRHSTPAIRRRRKSAGLQPDVGEPAPEPVATAASGRGLSTSSKGSTGRRRRGSGSGTGAAGGDADVAAASTRVTDAVNAASAAADAAAHHESTDGEACVEPRGRRRRGPPAAADSDAAAATALGSAVATESSRDYGASGGGAGLDAEGFSVARARVLQIKAGLLRGMRSATTSPSQGSVKLILTPMESGEAMAAAEPLRAEPLRPAARRKARQLRASEALAPLRPGEQGRRLEQQQHLEQQQARQQQQVVKTDRVWRGVGPRNQWRAEQSDVHMGPQAGPSGEMSPQPRVLRPLAARRSEATAPRRPGVTAGAGPAAAAAAGVADVAAVAGAGEAAAVETAAATARGDGVQRANEEFARYIESVAAAAAAEAESGGGRGDAAAADEERRPDGSVDRSDSSAGGWQQQRQQQNHLTWAKRSSEQSEAPPGRQQEQASLLRGLAQMFMNFVRQPQPAAAAAAAVAAAASPAAAAAVAAMRTDATADAVAKHGAVEARASGSAGGGPLAGSLGLGHANEVQMSLQPLTGKKLAEAKAGAGGEAREDDDAGEGSGGSAAAGGDARDAALHARPLATRADLLRQMRPVARARLPPYTRSVGLRISGVQRPRLLRLPEEAPTEALELVGDGAGMSPAVLRALRRRAYFYRQVAPKRPPSLPPPQQQQHSAAAESGLAADHEASQKGEATAAAAAPPPRPRPYSLSGRTFKIQRRVQYLDTVKRTIRRASLDRGTAAAGGAAAAAVDAGVGGGAEASPPLLVEEEAEEDPRGEYNSAAEVVNDMYEQIMGVRLPERAMYGRRAEALAAMSPSAVKEQTRSWVEACGKDYALAFHGREPLLLTTPAATLLLSLENLSRVFGLPPEECVQLALRNPSFVGMPYEQLRGTVEAVSEALEIGLQEAGKIVIKCPGLAIRQSAFPVGRRLELLGALLPVSREKLRQVVRQRPQLLSKSAQSLAAFMINASSALGLPLFDVSLMIAGCPGVTGVSAARLGSRWAELQRAAGLLPAWREQLAAISPPSLGRCLVANEAALARLQVVVERGFSDDPELSSLKKVLTMSGSKFEALTSPRAWRGSAAVARAAGAYAPLSGHAAATTASGVARAPMRPGAAAAAAAATAAAGAAVPVSR